MRRSRQVLAPLLASTAVALLAGCRGPEMQRCVDENNHVVDPVFCKDLPPAGRPAADVSGSHGAAYGVHRFRTYYGGSGSYAVGSSVSGGGFVPASGHSYSTTTGTARGGFGSSFSSHGGGEGGEGGGHGGGGGE